MLNVFVSSSISVCGTYYFILIFKPCNFRGNVRSYIKQCWTAVTMKEEMPPEDADAEEFGKKVSFMEAITESIPQLLNSCLTIRSFGISVHFVTKFFQLFSFITSLISTCIAFGMVRISIALLLLKSFKIKIPGTYSETVISKSIKDCSLGMDHQRIS